MAPLVLWLYRVLLVLALPLVAPFLWVKDRATGKSRPPLAARLGRRLEVAGDGIWIHAVSVGEVEIAARLIHELSELVPGLPLFLTATTATGLARGRKIAAGLAEIHPAPLDFPLPVRRFLDAARPRLLVLVETELWPELICQAAARGVGVVVVNARLSERSFARYRRVRLLLAPLLGGLRAVLARDRDDARRFKALGIPPERVRTVGNIKYDLAPDPTPLPWADELPAWAGDRPVVVAGSTMAGEERTVIRAWRRLSERPFLILAPRHPERFDEVAEMLAAEGAAFVRRSELPNAGEAAPDVLLLDTIGELARAYALARVAFVGGSLVGTGGHNPLEAAAWGVPAITGPAIHNFREVYERLVAAGGARVVTGEAELADALAEWLASAGQAAGERARQVVEASRGAVAETASYLAELAGPA